MRALLLLTLATTMMFGQPPDGAKLYQVRCGVCHNEANPRAPSLENMRARSPESILATLTTGVMRVQGAKLNGAERRAIAEFVTGKTLGGNATGSAQGLCPSQPRFEMKGAPLWHGWGPDHTNTRFTASAGFTAEQVPQLKLRWAFGFPDAASAWAQPALAGGRVFVGSQNGTVFSLDARTGCIYWTFSANGGVRTGMSLAARKSGKGYLVLFGDTSANMYAVDASTGKQVWRTTVEQHPAARVTGSPTLYGDRIYVPMSSYEEAQGSNPDYECCTFRGSLSALDVETGRIIWKTYTVATEPKRRGISSTGKPLYGPAGVAIWSAPTVDTKRKLVYAATGNTYSDPDQPTSDSVVAFDLATGKIRWIRQATPGDVYITGCRGGAANNPNCPQESGPDYDFGTSPILVNIDGKDLLVVGQKSGVGFALDPDKQGAIVWQYRAGEGGALGGIEWGTAVDAEKAYFPLSDITRPKPGGLHAVDLKTGQRVWYAPPAPPACGTPGRGCNAAQPSAPSIIPGVIFAGSNDGAIRAHSTTDGKLLWEFNTNREFDTVNGVPARGASMHGPGPAIGGGMMFLNSGYGAFGGRPGNVLLAFGVD
jgi:polyvinyl alcohol dehydrogenase (cytochrome)